MIEAAEEEVISGSERGGDRPLSDRERGRERDRQTTKPPSVQSAGDEESDRKKIMEIWRKYSSRWETWATGWSARGDPYVAHPHPIGILC